MRMEISYNYYKALLTEIKKDKKNATKKDVIEYLNKHAGILHGVKFLTIV